MGKSEHNKKEFYDRGELIEDLGFDYNIYLI